MQKAIPSIAEVRERLAALTRPQLVELSEKTGAPFHTLLKIRRGETLDPRLETVRAVWPHIANKRAKPQPSTSEA